MIIFLNVSTRNTAFPHPPPPSPPFNLAPPNTAACTADIAGPDGEASLCVGVRSTARDSVTGTFYCCPHGGDPTESSHTTNIDGKQRHHYQCDCLTPSEVG